jgi:hypothetical protein
MYNKYDILYAIYGAFSIWKEQLVIDDYMECIKTSTLINKINVWHEYVRQGWTIKLCWT